MSIRSKGLVFAMEEAEVTDVVADESEIAEGMSEIDSEALERNEEATEIEDLEMAIEDAMEDADTLEDIGEVMEESVESGEGLSPEAAEMAEIAVESICNRLGIRNKKILPAMESFGSSSSRLAATRIALEATEETGKGIWARIWEALQKLGNMIAEFFQKLMGGLPKVESVSKSLRAQLDKFKGENAKSKVIDNAGLAKLLGDKNNASNVATNVQTNLAFLTDYQNFLVDYAGKLESEYGQLESVPFYKFKEKAKANKEFADKVIGAVKGKAATKDVANSFELLDKYLVINADETSEEGGVSDPKVVFSYQEKKLSKSATLEVLDAAGMKSMLDDVDLIVKFLKDIKTKGDPKKITGKFSSTIKKAIAVSEKAAKKEAGKEGGEEAGGDEALKYIKQQAKNISQLNTSIGKVYKDIPSDAVRTCHTLLKYVNLSMKEYGAQSADAKAGENSNDKALATVA